MSGERANRIGGTTYRFDGPFGSYLRGVTEQWLKIAPFANPAMLEMIRDRDRKPLRKLCPWAGEFAGKYLVSAVQAWRLNADPELKEIIAWFVDQLIDLQDGDGYLGPWPKGHRLNGVAPNVVGNGGHTWDAWGHYHLTMGLLMWHEDTGSRKALRCATKMGDLLCRLFLDARPGRRLVDVGATEMNMAAIHGMCRLHRATGTQRYLDLSLQLADEFAAEGPDGPLTGDYIRTALKGIEFFRTPKPRWESLHPIMGIAELYWITGEEKFRKAFEHIWWSIAKLDRHNNGGFSSVEQAQGNPYHLGPIETCCTVAWTAMTIEMLRITGSSVVADELELTALNSVLSGFSHTGRWVTYDTPMNGEKKASAHAIVFQARPGSPELNCCSVNGPRAIGMAGDWALMKCDNGVMLNWYGPSSISSALSSNKTLELIQETDYPRTGVVKLTVNPSRKSIFTLKLRIPHWSPKTRVAVNGKPVRGVTPGGYLSLRRSWKKGDIVEIAFDMSLHYWRGEKECRNKVSIYRGPILLTYDRRFNDVDPRGVPELDARAMKGRLVKWRKWIEPILLMEFAAESDKKLRLCDFASAGEGGSHYRSWLRVKNVSKTPFSRENPLRSGRV